MHPLQNLLIFGGDLNRSRDGDLRYYHDPLRQAEYIANPTTHSHNISACHREWDDALSTLVEVDTHRFTHYSSAENYENRIDRVFWSLPPWATRLLSVSKPIFPPASAMH
eukprot:6220216-Karenia_brevis.AAC.1